MCDFDIMTTICFAEVHNMSFNILNGNAGVKVHDELETIGPSANYYRSHTMRSYMRTGLAFLKRHSEKVIYCPKTRISNNISFDYSVCIEPFPLNVWVLFSVLFVLVPYGMFAKGIGNKLEGTLALLSWQSISPKKWKVYNCAVVCFNAFEHSLL